MHREAGIGIITGEALDILFSVTVASKETDYQYYGVDDKTAESSRTFQGDSVYRVVDEKSKYLDNTYAEGLVYNRGGKHHIANALCSNLYGTNFEYA